MDPVFVTGGTGFVGGHLLDHLIAAGHPVTALVRSRRAARGIERRGAFAILGDVLDEASLRSGMSGNVVTYHVAGVNATCPTDPGQLYRTNVDGTRRVVRAAAAAGVRRVVLTSSVTALGTAPGAVGSEESPSTGYFPSHYARSKHLGERAAFDEGANRGVEVIAVLPASVQGPGRSEGSARLFRYALQSRRPVVLPVAVSIVDVRDCTAAHVLAAQRGIAGERYIASGATRSAAEILEELARIVATPIRPVVVPTPMAAAVGYALAAAAVMLPGDRDLCPELLRTLLHDHRYDGSKAVRNLGLSYTPFPETLHRIVDWFREEGLVGPD